MEENRRLDDRELENVSGGGFENSSQDIVVVREILDPAELELEYMLTPFDREMVFKSAKNLGFRIFEIKGSSGVHSYATAGTRFSQVLAPGDHVELDYIVGLFGYEIANCYHK